MHSGLVAGFDDTFVFKVFTGMCYDKILIRNGDSPTECFRGPSKNSSDSSFSAYLPKPYSRSSEASSCSTLHRSWIIGIFGLHRQFGIGIVFIIRGGSVEHRIQLRVNQGLKSAALIAPINW